MWRQEVQTDSYLVTSADVLYEEANQRAQSTTYAITRSENETILNQIMMPDNWAIRSMNKVSQLPYHRQFPLPHDNCADMLKVASKILIVACRETQKV
jgi:hypothetical protein